jgi:hypothetical protein
VSGPVTTFGFGDGAFSAMARPGSGTLVCRRGETATLAPAVIEWREDDHHWHAESTGAFDVTLEPLGEAATFADGSRESLCLVSGHVDGAPIACLGHVVLGAGGPPSDWRKTALVREVAAWFDADLGFAVHARRPARADAHEAEALEAVVLRGAPPAPVQIDDPRLSTAYADGWHQHRAGLELWETEESDHALRLAGEAIGEGELTLPDGATLRSTFLLWRHDGLVGTGRYDIVRAPAR